MEDVKPVVTQTQEQWEKDLVASAEWTYAAILTNTHQFSGEKSPLMTFSEKLNEYCEKHGETSYFAGKFLQDLMRNFHIKSKFIVNKDTKESYHFAGSEGAQIGAIPPQTGMLYFYNLLYALKSILNARLSYDKNGNVEVKKSSEFLKPFIEFLSKALFDSPTKFPNNSKLNRKKALKPENANQLIEKIDEWLKNLAYYTPIAKEVGFMSDEHIAPAIYALFEHLANRDKQSRTLILTKRSHSPKIEKGFEALLAYFTATISDDYVELFRKIAEGIQTSRSEGRDADESRKLEFALVEIQNQLLYKFFQDKTFNYDAFSEQNLIDIMKAISYSTKIKASTTSVLRTETEISDMDVSRYTMVVLDQLEAKSGKKLSDLRIQHLKRLLLEIPDEINGQKVDKAQYCYDKGPSFVSAMAALLDGSSLSKTQKEEVGVLGYIWNFHMTSLYDRKVKVTADYLVPQKVGPLTIMKHPLLPHAFRNKDNFLNAFANAAEVIYRLSNKQTPEETLTRDRSVSTVSITPSIGEDERTVNSIRVSTNSGSGSQTLLGRSDFVASQTQSHVEQTEEEKPWTYEEYCKEYQALGYSAEQLKEGHEEYFRSFKSNASQLQNQ